MQIRTKTVPTIDSAVGLDVFKQHLRVTHHHEDALLQTYLAAATKMVERMASHVLRETEFEQVYESFPSCIELEKIPYMSVESIEYRDEADVLQTLATSNYRVVYGTAGVATIYPVSDWGNPSLYDREDAVIVTYKAGYASNAAVPVDAKHAVTLLATHYNQMRQPVVSGNISEVPDTLKTLISCVDTGQYL